MREDTDALSPEMLLHAYQAGIFPMADGRDSQELFWVDPKLRGIFELDKFRISQSLAKRIRTCGWDVRRNFDFAGTVSACADRPETWINGEIRALYQALHQRSAAHSLELWDDDQLVGGVYGVTAGSAFFGESMFSKRRDASKVALAYLVTHLQTQGFSLFDTQFLTDHLASLGAIEISRSDYHHRLHEALQIDADFTAGTLPSAQDVVQRRTQTS